MSTPPFLDLPPGVRARTLDTSRGPFAALVAGPTDPAAPRALLVPGFTGSKEDFIAVLRPIGEAGYAVAAYDQRGQYETTQTNPGPPPEGWCMPALATDLNAVADHLGGTGGRHLLGHSFGGLVARRAVLDRPGAYTSLVLLGSGPAHLGDDRVHLLTSMASALPARGLAAVWALTQSLDAQAGVKPPQDPAVAAFMHHRFMANDPDGLASFAELLATEPDLTDQLAAQAPPTLVAFGEHDDGWSPGIQRETASRLGATVVSFPEAAHSPAAEAPEATAKALLDFWMRSEGAGQPPTAEEDL